MKKLILCLTTLVLLFSMTACATEEAQVTTQIVEEDDVFEEVEEEMLATQEDVLLEEEYSYIEEEVVVEEVIEEDVLSNLEVLDSLCGLWDYSGNAGKSMSIRLLIVTAGENGLYDMKTGLLASEFTGQYTMNPESVVYQGNDMYNLEVQGDATKKLSVDMSDLDNIILIFEDDSNQYFCYVDADVNKGMAAMEEEYFWSQSKEETSQEVTVETPAVEPQILEKTSTEELATKLAVYCNALMAALGDDGTYVIFDNETFESDTEYMFVLRYQISQEKADEIIVGGGMPSANRHVGEVIVEKVTGTATWGSYTWNAYV